METVVLLTSSPENMLPGLGELAKRDEVLVSKLAEVGFDAVWVEWGTAGSVEQAQNASAVVIRSTWDYSDSVAQKDKFVGWLREATSAGCDDDDAKNPHSTLLINPLEVVTWNSDKQYMRQLESAGVPIIPTLFVERGAEKVDLRELSDRWSCDYLVSKPVVGASSRGITKHENPQSDAEAATAAACVQQLAEADGMALVQPFVPTVLERGETSVVCIGGEVLFAVVKKPKGGDFRVQEEWGGTREETPLTPALVGAAKAVLAAIPSSCAYARLDFVWGADGNDGDGGSAGYLLMEAECIEPELYFDWCPAAAAALARQVRQRVDLARG